jgi:hypothetical protein
VSRNGQPGRTTLRNTEVNMPNLLRKSDGQPIRDAAKAKQISYRQLAEATKDVDATGRGISLATVSQVAGSGDTAKQDCRLRTAWLIAEALDEPLQHLFAMPGVSTDTVERSHPDDNDDDTSS